MKHSKDGLSLLEVLISLGLLATVMLAVVGIFLSGYAVASTSSSFTVAGQLAQGEMAALKGAAYADLAARAGQPAQSSQVNRNNVEYRVNTSVDSLQSITAQPADAMMLRLLVTVTWQDTSILDSRGLQADKRKDHHIFMECHIAPDANY